MEVAREYLRTAPVGVGDDLDDQSRAGTTLLYHSDADGGAARYALPAPGGFGGPMPTEIIPAWIDLAAVAVGAIQGSVFAVHHNDAGARPRLALIGIAVLAVVMGLGGGIVRDVLLDLEPVALQGGGYLVTALAAGAAGFVLARILARAAGLVVVFAAAQIAIFVVVGTLKAQEVGLEPLPAIIVGVVASVGGGVLRDLLAGQPPALMQPGTLTGAGAAAGATTFVVLEALGLPSPGYEIAGGVVAFVLPVGAAWVSTRSRVERPG